MSGPRGSRVVFVGNIPYELTEEQLTDVFKEVGPVLSFRLVFDRENGKPRGYGFCEYHDAETAASAVRNLNNVEVGGRPLRVDFADGDPSVMQDRIASNPLPDPRGSAPYQQQAPMQQPPQPPQLPAPQPPLQQFGAAPGVQANQVPATELITKTLGTLTQPHLYDVMSQMKMLVTTNPDQARTLLTQNPQLTYALFQAMLMMNIVEPAIVQRMLQSGAQAQAAPVPLVPNVNFQTVTPAPAPALYAQMPQILQQPLGIPMMNVAAVPPIGVAPNIGGIAVPPAAPAINDIQEQQKALLLQVLQLTPEQINSLPPEQRQNIMQLKAQIMLSQT